MITRLSSSIRIVLFLSVCCVSSPIRTVPLPEVIAGSVKIRVFVPVPTLLTSNLALGPCASSRIKEPSSIVNRPVTLTVPVPFGAKTISVLVAVSSTAVTNNEELVAVLLTLLKYKPPSPNATPI